MVRRHSERAKRAKNLPTLTREHFINDIHGQRSMVVLPIKDFDMIMEELEELEDIRLYDKPSSAAVRNEII